MSNEIKAGAGPYADIAPALNLPHIGSDPHPVRRTSYARRFWPHNRKTLASHRSG